MQQTCKLVPKSRFCHTALCRAAQTDGSSKVGLYFLVCQIFQSLNCEQTSTNLRWPHLDHLNNHARNLENLFKKSVLSHGVPLRSANRRNFQSRFIFFVCQIFQSPNCEQTPTFLRWPRLGHLTNHATNNTYSKKSVLPHGIAPRGQREMVGSSKVGFIFFGLQNFSKSKL